MLFSIERKCDERTLIVLTHRPPYQFILILIPQVSLSGGEVGAVVPALVISVTSQATASSSSHLSVTEQPGLGQEGEEGEGEEGGVHVVNMLTTVS